ncbi:NmrA/HSCARG family protein [Kutzneria sp. CA-103260]|uniref:NmrA/HSCARG family protein n=1 Tax=Kutzneria sp. CA-103260 TaxID=2802641 RepID=UPI001BA986E3|nr:NmrA/HSCARG family protein [Kutzneria sp. CA-103260]QUQ71928.1 NAD(P)H azoreductase [Kutzneria sp. CA-103260]
MEPYRLTVAVTGASGTQGGATARALLEAGHRVRALTRRPEAVDLPGAEVVAADFDQPESLDRAFDGADAVFLVTTPFGTDLDTEIRHGVDAVDAAVRAGVGHIVYTSATNADRGTGIPHFDSKWVVERHLADVSEDWTVIAPAAFMDNIAGGWAIRSLKQGRFSLPLSPGTPLKLIAAADIGAFAALVIGRRDEFRGRRVDIASDERTGREMARALGAVVGRDIQYDAANVEDVARYSTDLAAMFDYFDRVGMDVDITRLRADHPEIGWHSFADWARLNAPRLAGSPLPG